MKPNKQLRRGGEPQARVDVACSLGSLLPLRA